MELLGLILVCLWACLSFLFSGMEAGVFALSRLRIRQQMRAGNVSARLLHGYLENPENFLWTILVGNTIVNFGVLGLVFAWLQGALGHHRLGFVLAFLVIVFAFYTLCDLLPKMLFRTYPNRLCMALARPFRTVHLGLRLLVGLLELCSRLLLGWTGGKAFRGELFGNREELRLLMQESAQALTSEERGMINRVLDLQTLTVGQIATPLAKAVTVNADMPLSEVIELTRERNLTRLPVWSGAGAGRRIAGVLNVEALLFEVAEPAGKTAADCVKPAVYLGERMRLEEALRRLQRSGQRLAVVLGRDGREMGILGLQDILAHIFGEVKF